MKQINESFKKKYANLSEAPEVEETLTPQQELRKALENKLDELESKGTLNIKDYEIGFQDVIENLYPDKSWWEVTDCNIFMSLFNSRQPEETIMDIIANMKVNESVQVKDTATKSKGLVESNNSYEYKGYVIINNDRDGNWFIKGENGTFSTSQDAEDFIDSKTESLKEDTVKTSKGKWTNKGDSGKTHGTFKTKKAADAQRRAIWVNWDK